jgi:hypothetical protein
MIMRLAMIAVASCVLSGLASAAPSEAEAKAAGRQALIALRILAYDKQLAERSPGATVTIALVSSPTPEGRAIRERFVAGFAMMPKAKVGGRSIRIVSLDAGTEKVVTASLVAKTPTAVIVVDDLGDKLVPLRNAARALDVLTVSLREVDVSRGLSVGIVPARERDQIVINIEAARAEGVRFGAGLLQLARLVDEGAK